MPEEIQRGKAAGTRSSVAQFGIWSEKFPLTIIPPEAPHRKPKTNGVGRICVLYGWLNGWLAGDVPLKDYAFDFNLIAPGGLIFPCRTASDWPESEGVSARLLTTCCRQSSRQKGGRALSGKQAKGSLSVDWTGFGRERQE